MHERASTRLRRDRSGLSAGRVPDFTELRPRIQRAHYAVRDVIPRTGCELAAALLVYDLRKQGITVAFVRGHCLAIGEEANPQNLHAWVDVAGIVLDPTADQFGEDPLTAVHGREYVADNGDAPGDLEQHIYTLLNLQLPWKEAAVRALVELYGLDLAQLELAST